MNQTVSRDIETIDPNVAPSENAAVPSEAPVVPTTGIGQTHDIVDVAGLPSGTVSPIDESIPKPSGITTSDDAIESGTKEAQQNVETKDDPRRHEYWQSKHDKVMSELSEARGQIDHYQNTLEPIRVGLQQNPDILDALEQRVTGSNGQVAGSPQQAQQPTGNQPPSLQPPVRPQTPMPYNEVDAFNDPDSESFKYRQAKEQYNDNMIEHYGQVEQARNQQAAQYLQQQQNQMYLDNIRTTATNTLGYDPDKANRFMSYVQNPQNITTERMAALFEMEEAYNNGQTKETVERQRKAEEYQRQKDMQVMHTPVSLETGEAVPQQSRQDNFNSWLLNHKK